MPPFRVFRAEWNKDAASLRAVRRTVFVEEQHVPEALEWDDEDQRSAHVMAVLADGTPIGTGRLLPDGHIGRMAVLKNWRGRCVGSALMTRLVQLARESGHRIVKLHAQTHAASFYARHGFVAEGDEFMEAEIPHVIMTRTLSDA